MVITLEVPNNAQMGYGIGKCIQYGVEYNILNHNQIELTSADEIKLTKMAVAFRGKLLNVNKVVAVSGDIPKREVQYARIPSKSKAPAMYPVSKQDDSTAERQN